MSSLGNVDQLLHRCNVTFPGIRCRRGDPSIFGIWLYQSWEAKVTATDYRFLLFIAASARACTSTKMSIPSVLVKIKDLWLTCNSPAGLPLLSCGVLVWS